VGKETLEKEREVKQEFIKEDKEIKEQQS